MLEVSIVMVKLAVSAAAAAAAVRGSFCYGRSWNFSLATLWAFRKVDFQQMPVSARVHLCLGPDNACEMTWQFKSTAKISQ
jgi:hypothetical protein